MKKCNGAEENEKKKQREKEKAKWCTQWREAYTKINWLCVRMFGFGSKTENENVNDKMRDRESENQTHHPTIFVLENSKLKK